MRVSHCHQCASVVAVLMLVREPTTFDLEDWIGFKIDAPDEDDDGMRVIANEIALGQWRGRCPACDGSIEDPSTRCPTRTEIV